MRRFAQAPEATCRLRRAARFHHCSRRLDLRGTARRESVASGGTPIRLRRWKERRGSAAARAVARREPLDERLQLLLPAPGAAPSAELAVTSTASSSTPGSPASPRPLRESWSPALAEKPHLLIAWPAGPVAVRGSAGACARLQPRDAVTRLLHSRERRGRRQRRLRTPKRAGASRRKHRWPRSGAGHAALPGTNPAARQQTSWASAREPRHARHCRISTCQQPPRPAWRASGGFCCGCWTRFVEADVSNEGCLELARAKLLTDAASLYALVTRRIARGGADLGLPRRPGDRAFRDGAPARLDRRGGCRQGGRHRRSAGRAVASGEPKLVRPSATIGCSPRGRRRAAHTMACASNGTVSRLLVQPSTARAHLALCVLGTAHRRPTRRAAAERYRIRLAARPREAPAWC